MGEAVSEVLSCCFLRGGDGSVARIAGAVCLYMGKAQNQKHIVGLFTGLKLGSFVRSSIVKYRSCLSLKATSIQERPHPKQLTC